MKINRNSSTPLGGTGSLQSNPPGARAGLSPSQIRPMLTQRHLRHQGASDPKVGGRRAERGFPLAGEGGESRGGAGKFGKGEGGSL